MLFGFILVTLIFEKDIVIASMLITSISDSLAAIIGMKFGTIRLKNNKSIEGFYTFFISTYIILFLFSNELYFYVLIISVIIAFSELITPTKYDNIIIPILSSLCLYLIRI